MTKQLPPIKIRCRRCEGDSWIWDYAGLGSDRRRKLTCPDCLGQGFRMISPFELDPMKDIKL